MLHVCNTINQSELLNAKQRTPSWINIKLSWKEDLPRQVRKDPAFTCGSQADYSIDRERKHSRFQGLPKQNGLKGICSFDLINSSRQNNDIYSLHSIASGSHTNTSPTKITNSFAHKPVSVFSPFLQLSPFTVASTSKEER